MIADPASASLPGGTSHRADESAYKGRRRGYDTAADLWANALSLAVVVFEGVVHSDDLVGLDWH